MKTTKAPPSDPRYWDWYSVAHAASELGMTKQGVQWRCLHGSVSAVKLPNYPYRGLCWRIDPASVTEMKKRRGLA